MGFFREVILGKPRTQEEWINRDVEDAERNWKNRDLPSKWWLTQIIGKFKPRYVLEVGCCTGSNLFALALEFPFMKLYGYDINKTAITYGMNRIIQDSRLDNIHLNYRDITKGLRTLKDKCVDVTFSWATLMHIENIEGVIENMIRLSRKGIIILERHHNGKEITHYGHYLRNYREIFLKLGIQSKYIKITKIPKEIWSPRGGDANLIEVKL